MGGFGSGRGGGRPTVEASLRLELPRFRRAGYIKPGCKVSGSWTWTRGDERCGSVAFVCIANPQGRSELVLSFTLKGEPILQHIALEAVPMRFGGWRWFARCPFSGRRCSTLVLPNGGHRFASVKAWRLPYASQNEDAIGRAHRRIAKAEARLEQLSKFARRPTWERLYHQIENAEAVLDCGLARVVQRLLRR